jgi:hypothetical protein
VRDDTWPKESDFSRDKLSQLYWTKISWTNHIKSLEPAAEPKGKKGRSRAAQGINVNSQYIVDKSGKPVDGHRVMTIRSVARSIWVHLSDSEKAPYKWGKASLLISDMYRTQMESHCEELRLCASGWKAEQIATDGYTSWRNARIENGTFNVPPKTKHSTKHKTEHEDAGEDDSDSLNESEKENVPAKRKNKTRDPVAKKSRVNADDIVVLPRPRPKPVQVRVNIILCYFTCTT